MTVVIPSFKLGLTPTIGAYSVMFYHLQQYFFCYPIQVLPQSTALISVIWLSKLRCTTIKIVYYVLKTMVHYSYTINQPVIQSVYSKNEFKKTGYSLINPALTHRPYIEEFQMIFLGTFLVGGMENSVMKIRKSDVVLLRHQTIPD